MPVYRRWWQPGGTYFFTVNLNDRRSRLLVDYIVELRSVLRRVRRARPFHIDAAVILPDHLHMLWTLPPEDHDFSTRWRLIKGGFSHAVDAGPARSSSRRKKGERHVWQRRFYEHLIRDEDDFAGHVDYIHYNPVKHGLTARPIEWPWSTIHRYVAAGIIPRHWGTSGVGIEYDWDV